MKMRWFCKHHWRCTGESWMDSEKRPFLFYCTKCGISGHWVVLGFGYDTHVRVKPITYKKAWKLHKEYLLLTPGRIPYLVFRQRGWNCRTSVLLSYDYWPQNEKKKVEENSSNEVSNSDYISSVLRLEESKYQKILNIMIKQSPSVIEKRGLSPDTLGFCHATYGWDAETLSFITTKTDNYWCTHKDSIKEAIQKYSGGRK